MVTLVLSAMVVLLMLVVIPLVVSTVLGVVGWAPGRPDAFD